jgi:hypothetical protein
MLDIDIAFSGTVCTWHGGKATWFYVRLPKNYSDEVKTLNKVHSVKRRGFGGVKVSASIKQISWQTSIFPAFDNSIYTLFLKADVRKAANIVKDDLVTVQLKVHII